MVTMLLIFGVNQGLEHYHPTCLYLIVTGFYYTMTEKSFVQKFPAILSYFRFELLESSEGVWAQVILKSTTAAIAAIFCFLGFVYGKFSNCYFYSVWMKRHLI